MIGCKSAQLAAEQDQLDDEYGNEDQDELRAKN